MSNKILLVDDDANVLQGYERQLRSDFDIETAPGGQEALAAIADHGPFAVIVSDMRMPGMDGVQFLAEARRLARDSVRMMFTGNADQQTAIDAVNEGHIFRFLNKPCEIKIFAKALQAGLEQYRLVTAEHELLSKTLAGSVSLLSEVLSLVNPVAFGRSTDARYLVRHVCTQLKLDDAWKVEVAAMLSQVGCVTVPTSTLEKIIDGKRLSGEERKIYENHPLIGRDLVVKIPRLEEVGEIVAYQGKRFDGTGLPADGKQGEEIPLGARILKLVLDYNALCSETHSEIESLVTIRERRGWYDPRLVDVLEGVLNATHVIIPVTVEQLTDDMILEEHVLSASGDILLAAGDRVVPVMRQRLTMLARCRDVREPFQVRCPVGLAVNSLHHAPTP